MRDRLRAANVGVLVVVSGKRSLVDRILGDERSLLVAEPDTPRVHTRVPRRGQPLSLVDTAGLRREPAARKERGR